MELKSEFKNNLTKLLVLKCDSNTVVVVYFSLSESNWPKLEIKVKFTEITPWGHQMISILLIHFRFMHLSQVLLFWKRKATIKNLKGLNFLIH